MHFLAHVMNFFLKPILRLEGGDVLFFPRNIFADEYIHNSVLPSKNEYMFRA